MSASSFLLLSFFDIFHYIFFHIWGFVDLLNFLIFMQFLKLKKKERTQKPFFLSLTFEFKKI